jgi:hypothetical protein
MIRAEYFFESFLTVVEPRGRSNCCVAMGDAPVSD